jgi:hypothetical protein
VGAKIFVTTLATPAEKLRPLLYFRQGQGTAAQPPVSIDDIDDLLIGLSPRAAMQVPPEFVGCK